MESVARALFAPCAHARLVSLPGLDHMGAARAGTTVDKVKLETVNEGLSAQILHRGPYNDEGPTIRKLHHFVEENGYKLRADHHEIYLSDPRRSKLGNIKTIIRHPIEK